MVLLHAAARARCQRPAWHHGIVRCVSRTHRRCTLSRTSRLWTPAQDSVGRGIEQHTLAQKIRRVNMLPPVASVRSVALHHHAGLGSIRPLRHVQNHAEHTFSVKMRCATRAPRVSRPILPSAEAARRPQPAATARARPARGLRNSVKVPASAPQKHMPANGPSTSPTDFWLRLLQPETSRAQSQRTRPGERNRKGHPFRCTHRSRT